MQIKCCDCDDRYEKDLYDDGTEIVCVCGKTNNYLGYPEDMDIECEISQTENPCYHCYTGAIGECALANCKHQNEPWSKDVETMYLKEEYNEDS